MPLDAGLKPGTVSTEKLEEMCLTYLQAMSEGVLDHAGQIRGAEVLAHRIELLENTITAPQGTIRALYKEGTSQTKGH